MKRLSKTLSAACAAVIAVSSAMCVSAENWENYRGNAENNGAVTAATPVSADSAVLYWATKAGTDWTDAPSPITMAEDKIIFTSGTKLMAIDKETGEISNTTGDLAGTLGYAIAAPIYADGMIFVEMDGVIQAFDSESLESLWVYTDERGGSGYSSISYCDGYIYAGFNNTYSSGDKNTNFVCIDVTDEDKTTGTEAKQAEWVYTAADGWYCAGAYVSDNYVAVGAEDGGLEFAAFTVLDKKTGAVIDSYDKVKGDIRSTVVYDKQTGLCCFTSADGYFYTAEIDENGNIKEVKEIYLGGATACTPVVANGRAYVGMNGTGWSAYNGSGIVVVDMEEGKVAYKAETMGYPQTAGLLSTAYTDEDGYNYVYFTENTQPSEIRYIKDKKGVTEVVDASVENDKICAPVLFTPAGEQSQYCLCSLICDEDGTLYFKNDSSYIMAVGSTVTNLECDYSELCKEGEAPDFKVTAEFANGVKKDVSDKVTYDVEKFDEDDITVTLTYDYALYGDVEKVVGTEIKPASKTVDVTVLAAEDYDKVMKVIDLANEIPETITLNDREKIENAEKAYADLDESLRKYVEEYAEVIKSAREAYDKLNQESSSEPQSSSQSESVSESENSSDSSSDTENSSKSDSTSSKADSSKKASNANSANPATGVGMGGLAIAAAALAGAVVIKKRK